MTQDITVRTIPTLTSSQKIALKSWLRVCLADPDLNNTNRFPVTGLALYVNGTARIVNFGYWEIGPTQILVGSGNINMTVSKVSKLAILGSLINVVGLWDDLVDVFGDAVSRTLLENYNVVMNGLVESKTRVTSLAFNENLQQVAAYMDDGWYLPNGQRVDSIDGWTVAA